MQALVDTMRPRRISLRGTLMPSITPCACLLRPTRCDTDRFIDLAKDVLFVSVGFGVLGFQKAQVRRRELADAVGKLQRFLQPDAA